MDPMDGLFRGVRGIMDPMIFPMENQTNQPPIIVAGGTTGRLVVSCVFVCFCVFLSVFMLRVHAASSSCRQHVMLRLQADSSAGTQHSLLRS